jgi:hypothetical protein
MPAMLIGSVLWLAVRLRWLLRHGRRGGRGADGAFRLRFSHQVAELFTCLSHHLLHRLRHYETTLNQRFGYWVAASGYRWQ